MKRYHYSAELVRVIDGDTIVAHINLGFNTILKNETIRLNGINAPETRTKNVKEKTEGLRGAYLHLPM